MTVLLLHQPLECLKANLKVEFSQSAKSFGILVSVRMQILSFAQLSVFPFSTNSLSRCLYLGTPHTGSPLPPHHPSPGRPRGGQVPGGPGDGQDGQDRGCWDYKWQYLATSRTITRVCRGREGSLAYLFCIVVICTVACNIIHNYTTVITQEPTSLPRPSSAPLCVYAWRCLECLCRPLHGPLERNTSEVSVPYVSCSHTSPSSWELGCLVYDCHYDIKCRCLP